MTDRTTCPECPQHGAGYPIRIRRRFSLNAAAEKVECPNCLRWWEADRRWPRTGTTDWNPPRVYDTRGRK